MAHIDGEYDEGAVLVFLPGQRLLSATVPGSSLNYHV